MAKEYRVISDKWIEPLIPELNKASEEGWAVTYMLQEHAVTKIILEREKDQ
jgi:hypothetical protein